MRFLFFIVIFISGCMKNEPPSVLISDPTFPLVQLPSEFKFRRQNIGVQMEKGEHLDILNVKGPGCVRSIWLLRAEGKRIEIIADGKTQVSMPAIKFFGTLLEVDKPYHINSPGIVAMPNTWVRDNFGGGEPGYTSYLPIPFQDSLRISLFAEDKGGLSCMVNWHKYDENVEITPLRLHASYNQLNPGPFRGYQMEMVNTSGKGFIAGIFHGVKQLTFDDLMYHQGGITWFIDGETEPYSFRGKNLEDDYGFTWGFHNTETQWFGSPYFKTSKLDNPIYDTPIYKYQQEAVVYRFFGPDPISFSNSILMETGTRPDHTETIVYYYRDMKEKTFEISSPKEWKIIQGEKCNSRDEFEKEIDPILFKVWGDSVKMGGHFQEVKELNSKRGWVNVNNAFIMPHWTANLIEHSAYLKTSIESKGGPNTLRISFDDWIGIWINEELLGYGYHDSDIKSMEFDVELKEGRNDIIIKTINFDKISNNRMWVMNVGLDN